MSEFKFACPVCGQHITADSTTSGSQLECPTCFRKIVVPQAPASAETKFILSASQVSKPRPASAESTSSTTATNKPPAPTAVPLVVALVVLLCAAGLASWIWRGKLFGHARPRVQMPTNAPPRPAAVPEPKVVYEMPTNTAWTLDLTNAVIPDSVAAGSFRGAGFRCERALLQGGSLSLRQAGQSGAPELAVFINLFARQGEELSGKTVEITPDRPPPVPRVVLRWKEAGQERSNSKSFNQGYALKVTFREATGGRMAGRIYLALPDKEKTFLAGTFDAEIRKPPPPKRHPQGPPPLPKPKG